MSNHLPATPQHSLFLQIVLGKIVGREAVIDQCVSSHLIQMGKGQPFKVMAGKTVCTHDFYEGQARLDGAFCEYTNQDKNDYIKHLQAFFVHSLHQFKMYFHLLELFSRIYQHFTKVLDIYVLPHILKMKFPCNLPA